MADQTKRADGRLENQLRPLRFQNHIAPYASGSTLVEWGNTRVICGVTIEDTVAFAKAAKALGVDVVDCSSGGNTPVPPKLYPGYQVPYAEAVRKGAGVATMAIGLILDAELAETA